MSYTRPPYSKDAEFEEMPMMFSADTARVPKLEYPISVKENFRRAALRDHPVWLPNSMTDVINVSQFDLEAPPAPDLPEGAEPPASPWGSKERSNFVDDFGCTWTFVPEAGGPMLTPGVPPVVSDITNWEKEVRWPDFSKHEYVESQKKFMEKYGNVDKVLHLNIGQSCTERLVALLGGYEQSMVAMAVEPEAVRDFLMAFAEFTKDRFLKMTEIAKIDFVTFHDDWGTERDTFFSPAMMEEMVFEPTKLIIDAIKSRGCVFELHSCGKIERFIPYMIDLGIDFVQLQRRANDVPMLKEKYGGKIGFNTGLEGFGFGDPLPKGDELVEVIHKTVDLYGAGGGFYTMVHSPDPEQMWDATQELFCYSREFYEKENA